MQDLFAFLILGVGRLREDQFVYVETRKKNMFFIIWDLFNTEITIASTAPDLTPNISAKACGSQHPWLESVG